MTKRLKRVNDVSLVLENPYDIDVYITANHQVKIENEAVEELSSLLNIANTIQSIKDADREFFKGCDPRILKIAVTPDFHKGAGIPIGTVMLTKNFLVPQAIGNDVNCGMRLYTTGLTEDKLRAQINKIENSIRHVFFEGGRQIPMLRVQREALLRHGLLGLLETYNLAKDQGLWKYYDPIREEQNIKHVNNMGSMITQNIFGLENFLGKKGLSYDGQIGSIGGGNHFVEFQKIKKISDGQTAYAWNLKEGQVVIMIHTGSVMVGHLTGTHFKDLTRSIYPNSISHPERGCPSCR